MRGRQRIREHRGVVLDRGQLVWLTLGFVVCVGLSFALGFMGGRRAERLAHEPIPDDAIARIDADGAMHDELSFYKTLTKPAPVVSKPSPQPLAKAPKPASEPAATATPPQTQPIPLQPERSLKDALSKAAGGELQQTPSPKPGLPEGLNAGYAGRGDYTVQVSAFRSRAEAQAYAAGLERRGFKPYIVSATIPGKGTWHRVRVGSFDNHLTAVEAKQALARADVPGWVLKSD